MRLCDKKHPLKSCDKLKNINFRQHTTLPPRGLRMAWPDNFSILCGLGWWSSTRGPSQIWLQVRAPTLMFRIPTIFQQWARSQCLNIATYNFLPWSMATWSGFSKKILWSLCNHFSFFSCKWQTLATIKTLNIIMTSSTLNYII